MTTNFSLQEEVLALQDEASYHIEHDVVQRADSSEIRGILDGKLVKQHIQ